MTNRYMTIVILCLTGCTGKLGFEIESGSKGGDAGSFSFRILDTENQSQDDEGTVIINSDQVPGPDLIVGDDNTPAPIASIDLSLSEAGLSLGRCFDVAREEFATSCAVVTVTVAEDRTWTWAFPKSVLVDQSRYELVATARAADGSVLGSKGLFFRWLETKTPDSSSVPAPGNFTMTGPTAIGNDATPKLVWTSSKNAKTYLVRVGREADCSEPTQSYETEGLTQLLTDLAHGRHYACIEAKNAGGVVSASNAPYSFVIDIQPPTVTVSSPSASGPGDWLGTTAMIAGAADGTGSPLSALSLSIRDVERNLCFSGTHFDAACPQMLPASDLTDWSVTLPKAELLDAHNYEVSVTAIDAAGNTMTGDAVHLLAWDQTKGQAVFARIGSSDYDEVSAVAFDSAGNPVVFGRYFEDLTLGTTTLPWSGTGSSIFIAKYSKQGAVLWATHFSAAGLGISASDLAIDKDDNIVLAAVAFGNPDFGSGPVTISGQNDAFVVKLDPDGDVLWTKQISGPNRDYASAVVCDGDGNVYATGTFFASVDLGSGPVASEGGYDGFAVALNGGTGSTLWAKTFGSANTYDNAGFMEQTSAGSLFIAGDYAGQMVIPGGVTTPAGQGVWYAFYGRDGTHQSSGFVPHSLVSSPQLISASLQNESKAVFLSYFSGTNTIGGVGPYTTALNDYDYALTEVDLGTGVPNWTKFFGSPNADDWGEYYASVTYGADSGIYLAASLEGAVDFGGGPAPMFGGNDIVLVKFDSAGAYQWSRSYGGTGTDIVNANYAPVKRNFWFGPDQALWMTGTFYGTSSICGNSLVSSGDGDGFVCRIPQ